MESLMSGFLKSLFLHAALGGLLFATANFKMPTPSVMQVQLAPVQDNPQKEIVSAVSVDQKLVERKIAELKQQEKSKMRAARS